MTTTAPPTNDVAELFGMLFGSSVAVTEVEPEPGTQWLALSVFVTPEDELVAMVGADVAIVASAGAALAGYPVDDAEDAITKGRVNSDLWDNFAEVANVMTTLLVGDRFPRVLLREARRMGEREWTTLFGAALPTTVMRIDMEGYRGGSLAVMPLADVPVDAVPLGLAELAEQEPVPDDGWRPYSFRKPSGVNRDVLRALHMQTVELSRSMATSCNGELNAPIHQKVLQFQHSTWDDYAAGIITPSLFISFQLEPLEGRFLLTWPLPLAMALVDLMLGGSGAPLAAPRTPSALDLGLLERLFMRALAEVPALFAPHAATAVADVRVDQDPKLFQGTAFKSTFLTLWMSTEVAGVEYQSTLGIPTLAVQPFIGTILGRSEEIVAEEAPPVLRRQLLHVPVEVRVGFRPIRLPAAQLAHLRPGDVIALDPTTDEPLRMACGKVEVAAVEPVTDGDRLLVQVTREMIDPRSALRERLEPAMPMTPGRERQLAATA
ncbi:MAG TPA: FliM/FliN family flagellar motor switch protein [Acidimicrobiales bacterium]|nr:FliM/FliN family flagellar motor switch protein [Acidimicrobiales bacterium]